MNRVSAWLLVILLIAVTSLALLAPPWVSVLLLLLAFAIIKENRRSFLGFVSITVSVYALLLAVAIPGTSAFHIGQIRIGWEGANLGAIGALRLCAALGVNLAVLSRITAPRVVDAMGLPQRASTMASATILAAHDVGRDFDRIRTARRLEGEWPRQPLHRAREAARILPALVVSAHKRAATRSEALRLAGHDAPHWFVPVVAVAALAAAGRMAFLALPNVAATYAVVFLGGMLFGARIAFFGGCLGMLITDIMITGLYPLSFVNVPAMGIIGFLGGILRKMDFSGKNRTDRVAGALFAGLAGILSTAMFSLSADVMTWLLALRAAPGALVPLVLAGLAFNIVPAAINALIFAFSAGPTQRAFRAVNGQP